MMRLSLSLLALAGSCRGLIPLQPKSVLPTTTTTTTAQQAIAIPLIDPEKPQQQQEQDNTLEPQDAWIAQLDYQGFGKEVTALGKELLAEGGQDDVDHLNKILSWRNAAAVVGLATFWMTPNPITIAALSTWTYASWTMIAHHTCHGGYNRFVEAGKYNSRGFALGSVEKRIKDWLDWMQPEAWNIEHNRLHHYRLNEIHDPDLVQRNMQFVRELQAPMWQKYGIVAFFLPVWKWFYYAPNTFKELQTNKWIKKGKPLPDNFMPENSITVLSLLVPRDKSEEALTEIVKPKEFFIQVLGPFFLARYVLLPAPLLAIPDIGPTLFAHAIINLIAAELLTNMHAFLTIVTNHAGEDLYTFDNGVKPKTPSFYVRQIVGSANYAAGSDLIDFSHGWLNYQIEHHVWPDLSMLQYQKAAPKLQAICETYGVPYVQESVWERLRKTVDVMIGKTTMRPFPTRYEPLKDKAVNGVSWKSTNGAIDEDDEKV